MMTFEQACAWADRNNIRGLDIVMNFTTGSGREALCVGGRAKCSAWLDANGAKFQGTATRYSNGQYYELTDGRTVRLYDLDTLAEELHFDSVEVQDWREG